MKAVGIVFAALGVAVVTMAGSRSEAQSAERAAPTVEVAVDVTAGELAFDYLDETRGNAKWQTKRVNVTGIVDEIVPLKDGRSVVLLRPSRGPQIMAGTHVIAVPIALGSGDPITLTGCTVAGKTGRVGLLGCTVAPR